MSDLENSTSPHEGLIYGKSPRGKKLLQLRKETIGLFFQRAMNNANESLSPGKAGKKLIHLQNV